MLEFRDCSDVTIAGVQFQNSPYWSLHPYNCTGMRLDQVSELSQSIGIYGGSRLAIPAHVLMCLQPYVLDPPG